MSRYTAGMGRRTFLTTMSLAVLTAPPAVEAQQAADVDRRRNAKFPFIQGMKDLGYVEGRDFVMEYRRAEGQSDRLQELTADLVRARVDIIVTGGTPATKAAKEAIQIFPIVFAIVGGRGADLATMRRH